MIILYAMELNNKAQPKCCTNQFLNMVSICENKLTNILVHKNHTLNQINPSRNQKTSKYYKLQLLPNFYKIIDKDITENDNFLQTISDEDLIIVFEFLLKKIPRNIKHIQDKLKTKQLELNNIYLKVLHDRNNFFNSIYNNKIEIIHNILENKETGRKNLVALYHIYVTFINFENIENFEYKMFLEIYDNDEYINTIKLAIDAEMIFYIMKKKLIETLSLIINFVNTCTNNINLQQSYLQFFNKKIKDIKSFIYEDYIFDIEQSKNILESFKIIYDILLQWQEANTTTLVIKENTMYDLNKLIIKMKQKDFKHIKHISAINHILFNYYMIINEILSTSDNYEHHSKYEYHLHSPIIVFRNLIQVFIYNISHIMDNIEKYSTKNYHNIASTSEMHEFLELIFNISFQINLKFIDLFIKISNYIKKNNNNNHFNIMFMKYIYTKIQESISTQYEKYISYHNNQSHHVLVNPMKHIELLDVYISSQNNQSNDVSINPMKHIELLDVYICKNNPSNDVFINPMKHTELLDLNNGIEPIEINILEKNIDKLKYFKKAHGALYIFLSCISESILHYNSYIFLHYDILLLEKIFISIPNISLNYTKYSTRYLSIYYQYLINTVNNIHDELSKLITTNNKFIVDINDSAELLDTKIHYMIALIDNKITKYIADHAQNSLNIININNILINKMDIQQIENMSQDEYNEKFSGLLYNNTFDYITFDKKIKILINLLIKLYPIYMLYTPTLESYISESKILMPNIQAHIKKLIGLISILLLHNQ